MSRPEFPASRPCPAHGDGRRAAHGRGARPWLRERRHRDRWRGTGAARPTSCAAPTSSRRATGVRSPRTPRVRRRSEAARLASVSWMRNQRVATIEIRPAEYDPTSRQLTVHARVEVEVSIESAAPTVAPAEATRSVRERLSQHARQLRSGPRLASRGREPRSRRPAHRPRGDVHECRARDQRVRGTQLGEDLDHAVRLLPDDLGTAPQPRVCDGGADVPLDSLRIFTWPGFPCCPRIRSATPADSAKSRCSSSTSTTTDCSRTTTTRSTSTRSRRVDGPTSTIRPARLAVHQPPVRDEELLLPDDRDRHDCRSGECRTHHAAVRRRRRGRRRDHADDVPRADPRGAGRRAVHRAEPERTCRALRATCSGRSSSGRA